MANLKRPQVPRDHLVLDGSRFHNGLRVLGVARRPNTWVARHLRRQGALIASGIMVGYAGVFAAHISKAMAWAYAAVGSGYANGDRGLCGMRVANQAISSLAETDAGLATIRLHAPTLKQRALGVEGCGWSGLRSARAVARTHDYLSALGTIRDATDPASDLTAPSLATSPVSLSPSQGYAD